MASAAKGAVARLPTPSKGSAQRTKSDPEGLPTGQARNMLHFNSSKLSSEREADAEAPATEEKVRPVNFKRPLFQMKFELVRCMPAQTVQGAIFLVYMCLFMYSWTSSSCQGAVILSVPPSYSTQGPVKFCVCYPFCWHNLSGHSRVGVTAFQTRTEQYISSLDKNISTVSLCFPRINIAPGVIIMRPVIIPNPRRAMHVALCIPVLPSSRKTAVL